MGTQFLTFPVTYELGYGTGLTTAFKNCRHGNIGLFVLILRRDHSTSLDPVGGLFLSIMKHTQRFENKVEAYKEDTDVLVADIHRTSACQSIQPAWKWAPSIAGKRWTKIFAVSKF
jgi:hypothetical protein